MSIARPGDNLKKEVAKPKQESDDELPDWEPTKPMSNQPAPNGGNRKSFQRSEDWLRIHSRLLARKRT